MEKLYYVDPVINNQIKFEQERIEQELNLIASENYTNPAVLQATGSILTNKYAEGYPGKRYYAGCRVVDTVESVAIERAKQLFQAEHANVQPHSGSQANMAVYFALLKPGDTILGMSLAEGGHLTHGHKVNFSGTYFKSVQYHVSSKTERIDYDAVEELVREHKPKMIVCGASAYSRKIDFERLGIMAKRAGAYLLADIAHIAGLVVTDLHPHPFPHADVVTTTTHKTLRGPRGGLILCKKELAEKIDRGVMPGVQGGPFMHSIAAKAVAFALALRPDFQEYQKQVIKNSKALTMALQKKRMRAVAGGTDNHLCVLDLRSKGITGLQAEHILEKVGIITSRSCIPFDPEKPWITSGIRLGTPAVTTRGMGELEMLKIAQFIDDALINKDNEPQLVILRKKIASFSKTFPIYASSKQMQELVYYQHQITS